MRLAAGAGLALALMVSADAGTPAPTVVELYTSQGCRTSPPADALLADLARRDDVLALSFHIDYWDYLGWKDPFASALATARQRAYSKALGRRYVYTPQMVVDGTFETVGSRRDEVLGLIEQARARPKLPIEIALDGGVVRVRIGADNGVDPGEAEVLLVLFDITAATRVTSGENKGQTLRSTNVVREVRRLGTWQGGAIEFATAAPREPASDVGGVAVLVQPDGAGPILGAARMRPPTR